MKRAAIYLRVSTKEQQEKGWSIDGQYDECRKWCENEGYKVVRVYSDPGFSGDSGAGVGEKIILGEDNSYAIPEPCPVSRSRYLAARFMPKLPVPCPLITTQ